MFSKKYILGVRKKFILIAKNGMFLLSNGTFYIVFKFKEYRYATHMIRIRITSNNVLCLVDYIKKYILYLSLYTYYKSYITLEIQSQSLKCKKHFVI